jgi:Zn finger protein HypA/HybF involved in hydrogenase expression
MNTAIVEYECWKCGMLENKGNIPDGWFQVPFNVSVYLCPTCNKERLKINEQFAMEKSAVN